MLYLPLIYAPADERPFGMVFDPIDTPADRCSTASRSARATSRRARTRRRCTRSHTDACTVAGPRSGRRFSLGLRATLSAVTHDELTDDWEAGVIERLSTR